MKEIICTGNNDNGCFHDSLAHNCGCEGLEELTEYFEFERYLNLSMEDKMKELLKNIVGFYNAIYPDIVVTYKDGEFIIVGDKKQSEECRKSVSELIKFS